MELSESLKIPSQEINSNFTLLGIGSSRSVFDLNNDYVCKLAHNRKGYHQNSVEFQIYNSCNIPEKVKKYLNPTILKYRNKIISEKAKDISLSITGLYFNSSLLNRNNIYDITKGILENQKENSILNSESNILDDITNVINYLVNIPGSKEYLSLLESDLLRSCSWGIKNKNLVLIDYGCSKEVFHKFY